MRAWTLIASYLLKDIWRRWLETPGAVLARMVVAALLVAVLFFVAAAFRLAARAIESRIVHLGVNTLVIRTPVSPEDIATGRPPADALLAPLSEHGELLALKTLYAAASTEYGDAALPMAYGDAALGALAPGLSGPGESDGRYLLTNQLPSGIPVSVLVDNVGMSALTRPLPFALSALGVGEFVLLLPEASVDEIIRRGHQSVILFFARETAAIPSLADAARLALATAETRNVQTQSSAGWIEELASLRAAEIRWRSISAAACTAVLVLVFGSFAILEYRQNRYTGALLRSFGAPSWTLLLRSLAESALLLAVAALIARAALLGLHRPLFQLAGFDPALLGDTDIHLLAATPAVPVALAASALLSTLPIAWSLRQPVGKILQ